MSASCYTRRINVQIQARNAKVQYPGGRAVYNPLLATCAANLDFTGLTYSDFPTGCSNRNPCIPNYYEILDGQFSTRTTGCILDGGLSNSNYSIILTGGNSSL